MESYCKAIIEYICEMFALVDGTTFVNQIWRLKCSQLIIVKMNVDNLINEMKILEILNIPFT